MSFEDGFTRIYANLREFNSRQFAPIRVKVPLPSVFIRPSVVKNPIVSAVTVNLGIPLHCPTKIEWELNVECRTLNVFGRFKGVRFEMMGSL